MVQTRQALQELLDGLGESALFVTSGSLTPVLPGLEVKGAGSISFPLTETDARQLLAQATQAPYGRGEETLVDTSIRRVWQIEPKQIVLRNPEWDAHIAAIVKSVKGDLGIAQKVQASLYKLLLYEKGSFFKPHRDSEKVSGMFATLIVCLPAQHEGGSLIVHHDRQTQTISFAGKDAEFKTHYAAFYADCQHEITPLTSGYRVCLVYNLSITGKKRQPAAPQTTSAVQKATELLRQLLEDASNNLSRLVIPFQHQYTEAGFDPRQLKGSDRARFDVLVRAAEALDYECYLALLTHEQSGEVDYDTWQPYGYRSRRYSRWDDEEDDTDSDGAEMGEVYDEEWSLDHWLDPQGKPQRFGEMHLEESEVLSLEDQEDWSIEQHVREATGNEGVSMDRWYRQAVVVLWPRQRSFALLANEGQAVAIPALQKMAVGASKKPDVLANCRNFAELIVDKWKPHQPTGTTSLAGPMLKLLERIGTVELAQRFLSRVLPKDFDGSEGKALVSLGQHFGWEPLAAELRSFLIEQKPDDPYARLEAIVSLCEALCCAPPSVTEERAAVRASLIGPLIDLVQRWDTKPSAIWYGNDRSRTGVVASLVRILATSAPEQLEGLLAHVLADRQHYDLHKVLIPDVKTIFSWLPDVPAAQAAAERLLQHCLGELRAATAQPIEPPKDWRREEARGCRCEDCQALNQFLRDPDGREARFPLRKERRRHLHNQIGINGCDLIHETERVGSPQTLVCTKTEASYKRRLQQYEVDRKLLRELETLAETASTAHRAVPSKRKRKK